MPHVPASASCAPMLCHVPGRVRARVLVMVRARVMVVVRVRVMVMVRGRGRVGVRA